MVSQKKKYKLKNMQKDIEIKRRQKIQHMNIYIYLKNYNIHSCTCVYVEVYDKLKFY